MLSTYPAISVGFQQTEYNILEADCFVSIVVAKSNGLAAVPIYVMLSSMDGDARGTYIHVVAFTDIMHTH